MQLFIALASLFVSVVIAQVATVKWYIDARFNSIEQRLNSIDQRLNSIEQRLNSIETQHGERIAALEARSK